MNEHYREAANGCERVADGLRIRADKLEGTAKEKRAKANRLKDKANKLERAAVELRVAADGKEEEAKDYRSAATLLPRLDKRCIGCALGYVPAGVGYNEIHTCGQTVAPLRAVNE